MTDGDAVEIHRYGGRVGIDLTRTDTQILSFVGGIWLGAFVAVAAPEANAGALAFAITGSLVTALLALLMHADNQKVGDSNV